MAAWWSCRMATRCALIKHLEGVSDEASSALEVPNAVPLCYELQPGQPSEPARLTRLALLASGPGSTMNGRVVTPRWC